MKQMKDTANNLV